MIRPIRRPLLCLIALPWSAACVSPLENRITWHHTDISGIQPIGDIGVFDERPRSVNGELVLKVAFVPGAAVEFRRELYDAWVPRVSWPAYFESGSGPKAVKAIFFPIVVSVFAIANIVAYGEPFADHVRYRWGILGWIGAFFVPGISLGRDDFQCQCDGYPAYLAAVTNEGRPGFLEYAIPDGFNNTASHDLGVFSPPSPRVEALDDLTFIPDFSGLPPSDRPPSSLTNILPSDPTTRAPRMGVTLRTTPLLSDSKEVRGSPRLPLAIDHSRTTPTFVDPENGQVLPSPTVVSVLLPIGEIGKPLEPVPGTIVVSGAGIRREIPIQGHETVRISLLPFIAAHMNGPSSRQDLVLRLDVGYSVNLTISYNEWVRILLEHWIAEGL